MKSLAFLVLIFLNASLLVNAQTFQASSNEILLENSVIEKLEASSTISLEDFRFIPQNDPFQNSGSSLLNAPRTKPVVALLSSAIIPGAGQAANGKWGRAAVYLLAEAVSIVYYIDRNNTAKRNERSYQEYANQNWSVLAYAQWLVDYSEANGIDNGYEQLATQVEGLNPDFSNTTNDWAKVDIELVHSIEEKTPFYYPDRIASTFSHPLQDYGSQQYYELMSKYYQFQGGWKDFHMDRTNDPTHLYRYPWNASMITENFIMGRDRAEEFNQNYRQAGNILKFLLVNHVVSAFDAYFTVQLKNSRIETQANLLKAESFSVTWHF